MKETLISCPHGAECGACALLDTTYESQLARKRDVVAGALHQFALLSRVEPLPCLASPQIEGYRNRAKMAVELAAGRPAQVGYFRFGTRRLVDAQDCRVLVPEILETTRSLRTLLSKPEHATLPLRFLDVRCGTDPQRQHLTVVLDKDVPLPLAALQEACPRVTGISVNVNPGSGSQVIKGPVKLAWGERHVFVEAGSVRLFVSAGAFFQVNLGMLAPIHERLHSHFWGCSALADLYAGVGTHGLAFHSKFQRVLMIEGISAAFRDARSAVAAAGITNVNIVGAPVESSLGRFHAEGADAVVLNPSREGARPEVLEAIVASQAQRVAYLSCEPQTLARDIDALVAAGLRLIWVEPLDMMPLTHQVEALALLIREDPPSESRRAGPRARRG